MIIGDYEYYKGTGIYVNGASVSVVDKTKSSYGQILSYVTIDGQRLPVITMADTFRNCTNLIVAPSIPDTVHGMSQTFLNCTSLTTAPRIPPNVTTLYYCFGNCENLTGEVKVDTNQLRGSTQYTFRGTTKDIVLTGASQSKELLAASANNGNVSVWSLETAITARRDETTPTTVNVSVTVDRFRGNNEKLSSLILSKNGEQITANWNDPTLTMTNNSVTFTCTLTGIEQTSAPTLSVVATDNYGSSTATSIKVPVSFYTMDVQAGGKEIAFGGLADDDLTNYPSGLFKCYMNADFANGLMVGGQNLNDAIANYLKGAIVHEFYTIPSMSYAANSIHWHYNDARIPTKTGYTAIGIVGFSQNSSSLVSNLELLDGRIGGYTWNRTSSAVSIAITVDILYLRNDLVAT